MSTAKFFIPALCLASALTASGAGTADFNVASGAWEAAGSWVLGSGTPSLPPVAADTARFQFGGGSTATLSGDQSIARLTVGSATVLQGLGGLRTINLGAGTTSTWSDDLTLDQVSISKGGGVGTGLTILNDLVFANGGGISWAGTGALTLSSALGSHSYSGSGSISVTGGSVAFSGGANTTTIASGVGFTSSSTLSATQGTLDVASSAGSLSGVLNYGSANVATFRNSGTMTLGALDVGVSGTAGAPDTFDNTGTLTKTGAGALNFNTSGGGYTLSNSGTFDLGGAGTITFNTTLTQSAGILNFNSPSSVVLNAPITATGGSVIGSLSGATGAGTVGLSGASLSPGAGAGLVGSIAVPAALSLTGGSYVVDINGDASGDSASAVGAVTLAGTPALSVTAPNPITQATVFTILSGSSVTGSFDIADDSIFTASGAAAQQFQINYTGSSVTLTAVPEPQFYAVAAGLGLLGFTAWRRSQKRA